MLAGDAVTGFASHQERRLHGVCYLELSVKSSFFLCQTSLFFFCNIPKLCHISQKNSRDSRFQTKSLDSRKKKFFSRNRIRQSCHHPHPHPRHSEWFIAHFTSSMNRRPFLFCFYFDYLQVGQKFRSPGVVSVSFSIKRKKGRCWR